MGRPSGTVDTAALPELLQLVRRRQRALVVPPPGWLVVHAGGHLEPERPQLADSDGLVPLGALIQTLQRLLDTAVDARCVSRLDADILDAWYGLTAQPADLTGDDALRVAGERLPFALGRSSLEERRSAAVEHAATLLPTRPGPVRTVPAVPDPRTAPWFRHLGAEPLVEEAFTRARDRLATGSSRDTRLQNEVFAELERLEAVVVGGRRGSPLVRRLHRARAAWSICLYQLAEARAAARRATRGSPVSSQPPVEEPGDRADARRTQRRFGVPPRRIPRSRPRPSTELSAVAERGLNGLLRGDRGRVGVASAVTAVRRLAPAQLTEAWVAAQLVLGALHDDLPPELHADAILCAIEVARDREDWRGVLLTRAIMRRHPTSPATLYAAIYGTIIASAHRRYGEAEDIFFQACDLLDTMQFPPERDAAVERAEWEFHLVLAQTATRRREAEHRLMDGADAGDLIRDGHEQLQHCLRLLERSVPPFDGRDEPRGDAGSHYPARARTRLAEIRAVAAQSKTAPRERDSELQAAHRDLRRAGSHLTDHLKESGRAAPPWGYAMPLLKGELYGAVLAGDADAAYGLTRRLLLAGWPIERTVAPIFTRLVERGRLGWNSPSLDDAARAAADAAIGAGEDLDTQTWKVEDANRRRQLLA